MAPGCRFRVTGTPTEPRIKTHRTPIAVRNLGFQKGMSRNPDLKRSKGFGLGASHILFGKDPNGSLY